MKKKVFFLMCIIAFLTSCESGNKRSSDKEAYIVDNR